MVKKHESTAIRRGQIVDAARKLIIKQGSEHLTIKRIAKEVDMSEAAIYRHFKSKKDILSLLADHVRDNLVDDIARASASKPTSLATIEAILNSHLSAIEQRRGISFQVVAEIISLGDKKLNRKMADVVNEYLSQLKNLLSELAKTGEVRGDIDLEAAALLLFGMIQGLVNIWVLSHYSFDPREKYLSLWSIFRRAVTN